MTPDEYLDKILDKYVVDIAKAEAAGQTVYKTIENWANTYLVQAEFSGSIAKGTGISIGIDADIFISLSSTTPDTLAQIYASLYTAVTNAGYIAKKQNVSIGITVNGCKVDLVPAKRQSQNGNDHSLYRSKAKTWTKTNVTTHINHVKNSNRIKEIKLTKIWRELHNLDFPSFYLEMVVIEALKGSTSVNLANNFNKVLDFLKDEFTAKIYIDPANSYNTISDDLTLSEKKLIATQAEVSRNKAYWENIVS